MSELLRCIHFDSGSPPHREAWVKVADSPPCAVVSAKKVKIMIVRKEINPTQSLSPAQVEMLQTLKSKPVAPDEDCPALTTEQLSQFQRVHASIINDAKKGRMTRRKYSPRINGFRGVNRIKEDWLQEVFGGEYQLVWNGHSHFAKNARTGKMFYICKRDKRLIPTEQFFAYHSER